MTEELKTAVENVESGLTECLDHTIKITVIKKGGRVISTLETCLDCWKNLEFPLTFHMEPPEG